jgi:hypothetical protein
MIETLAGGLLGSVFGGLFRLAPEVLKWVDRKNEREHEYKMFTLQTDLEKVRGEYRMEERYVDHSVSQLDAISEAFKQQSKADANAWKWVASLSALVRPGVTYILFGMYCAFKISMLSYAVSTGANWKELFMATWTAEDFAMLNMILTFWFIGRTIEKRTSTGG